MNVSQVERQKIEEAKPVEINKVKEWVMKKNLNKRKIREIVKYLVQWKRFIAESNI